MRLKLKFFKENTVHRSKTISVVEWIVQWTPSYGETPINIRTVEFVGNLKTLAYRWVLAASRAKSAEMPDKKELLIDCAVLWAVILGQIQTKKGSHAAI